MADVIASKNELSSKIVTALGGASQGIAVWKKRLARLEQKYGSEAYRVFFNIVTHLDFSPRRAKTHWGKLVKTWETLSKKADTKLDLRVVVLHYFLQVQKKLKNPAVVEIKFLQEAQDSVIVDELTRLYNYRYFQHRIEQEMRRVRRYDRGLSLLMIDVDDFKWFNDRNGHLAGNNALRRLAQIFRKCVRDVDVVCRYGGEEFAVILPTTLKAGALIVAEKMRVRVGRARIAGGDNQPKGKVTVSIGVATVPTDATSADDVIARADAALYRAKAFGKDRVEAFSDERREFVRFRASLAGRLRILDKTALSFKTSNVSQGGILFSSRRNLAHGSIVQLELKLPNERQRWNCTARVVRVTECEKDYEIGVKILHVEGADLYRFQSLLARLEKEGRADGRGGTSSTKLHRNRRAS